MNFVMMSDTHYISRRMLCKEDSETLLQISTVEQALRQAAEQSDTIIISGDLTDDGDRPSHEDFAALLRSLKEQGKKIYVIFATHDFHHHRAFVRKHGDTVAEFTAVPWEMPFFEPEGVRWKDYVKPEYAHLSEEECTPQLVESVTPEELWDIYREFGREQAISTDEGSFSYCVDLDENTRCLMLNDIFRNEEALHDISATFTPSCYRWAKKMIELAEKEGKFIFVCSHHPFAPVVPLHRIGTGNRNLRSPEAGHTLADMGINLAFTGHTHANAVNFLKTEKGNSLCNIVTASVRFYPPVYRVVDLDGLNGKITFRCEDVQMPEDFGGKESLREHYYKEFYKQYFREYSTVKPPLDKIVKDGKVKDFYFLFKKNAGLSKEEYAAIKDKKLFDLLTDVIFNMVTGDGKFTPDTPVYRLMMSVAAFVDSVVDAQPFADIRKKVFKGYTARETIETLLFKNGVSDTCASFDFTADPGKNIETPVVTSHAGDIMMAIVWALSIPLSLLAPPAVIIGIPVKTALKKLQLKKKPQQPIYKY